MGPAGGRILSKYSLYSAPTCGARLPAAQPYQMRRVAALSWFRCAAACKSRRRGCRPCQVRSHLRVAALGYRPCQARCEAAASLPCRAATAKPLPTSTVGPLPLANSICRRASILLSSKEMFAMKLHVASVYFVCFKCFRGMFQMLHIDVVKVDREFCTCCKCFR